ncbi:hypothetical protein Cgig2_009967 [Carnegiea gigantea]|uniref:Uncharacterized protein n=1 Tax=Carnegiea gigantea TaxID=171969 RepID=A0A9Q1JP14_9CARY|nr:hypothetical protein Cgig2_009967 [Carnegiea gigantea]
MGSTDERVVAVIMIPNLAQIYLVGFYEKREFALYVSSISDELRVPVRYLREDKPDGSAGGLDTIVEDSPVLISFSFYSLQHTPTLGKKSQIFLLNCDVCSSFPLPEMVEAHRRYRGMGTILVSKVRQTHVYVVSMNLINEAAPLVSAESASQFGELVADPNINEAKGDCNAKLGITILGESVTVEDELLVIKSIVLPNKTLNMSVQEEIIL